jgi:hypothetical protein
MKFSYGSDGGVARNACKILMEKSPGKPPHGKLMMG